MSRPNTTNVNRKIGKLLEMVDSGQLVLPEIQRDFVWTKKSIKLLVDSLYRGLPVGNMLVWKAKRVVDSKAFHGRKLKRGDAFDGFYGYLLDGQQRLTALTHLREGDESYPLMFYLWPDRVADGDEALYWRGRKEEDYAWSVPIAEVLSENFSLTERLNAIKADSDFEPQHEEHVRRDLDALRSILDYDVGVTEFESDDYALATNLFVRFNSTGRKLSKSDLWIAELATHVPGLASKEMRRAQSRWANFAFTMPFLVQCLLAVHTRRFTLRNTEQFGEEEGFADIKESWRSTERAIGKLVEFLSSTVRWHSSSLVPSFTALIPLIVILARTDSWSSSERQMARSWLLLTSLHGYFSGSAQTQLDRVLRGIEKRPTIKKLLAVTQRSLRRLRASDFETGRLSGPVMSLFLSMLRDRDARDWKNIDVRLDGTVVGHGASLQVHHFFPKALLKKQKGLTHSDINTFANYAVISANTNLNVSTEEPCTYLERLKVPQTQIKKQAIPLDPDMWRVRHYRDFLAQRRKLLAEEANAFLQI
jgi:hypothetical protein